MLDAGPSVGENPSRMVEPALLRRGAGAFVAALAVACFLFLGCVRSGTEVKGNLLFGKAPLRSTGVTEPSRLTDGTVSRDGDHWETTVTSVLRSPEASVEWDLGRPAHVVALYLQGDNNDEFFVSGSDDGKAYRQIWSAEPV